MRSIVIASIVLMCLANRTTAQQKGTAGDTILKGTTIEVMQSYKPEVKPLPKPAFTPELPPRDTSRPVFRYDVPQQTLNYTYSSLPLRPLALGKDTSTLPFPGYLKLGGGNFSTIYLDGGIGNLKGEKYETAIHLHHLSQQGNIRNQRTSLSNIEAEGTLHTGPNAWRLSLDGLRNQYHYYGYDHNVLEFSRDTVKQTFTGIEVGLDVKNESTNPAGINYHPMVSLSIYSDKFDATERTIRFDVPVEKKVDEYLTAGIGVNARMTSLNIGIGSRANNIFQITPNVRYTRNGFEGKAGLYPTGGSYYPFQLLPDIKVSYKVPNSQFIISAGWSATINQNTYKQLTSENPYLFPIQQSPLFTATDRQTKTDEVFGFAQANLGNHITLSAKVSWWEYANLPMFLNDTGDRKNFYLRYDDKVNATSLQAGIRYQVANVFTVGATGSFYSFYKTSEGRAWHTPGVRIKGDLSWKPIAALTVTGYATLLDQIYALNVAHQEVKLNGVFDVGAGAEYLFIPRLSAFINVNNLLNDRYQRWYQYEAYGLNVYGGLRLKF